jgi:hypothetical protein
MRFERGSHRRDVFRVVYRWPSRLATHQRVSREMVDQFRKLLRHIAVTSIVPTIVITHGRKHRRGERPREVPSAILTALSKVVPSLMLSSDGFLLVLVPETEVAQHAKPREQRLVDQRHEHDRSGVSSTAAARTAASATAHPTEYGPSLAPRGAGRAPRS